MSRLIQSTKLRQILIYGFFGQKQRLMREEGDLPLRKIISSLKQFNYEYRMKILVKAE